MGVRGMTHGNSDSENGQSSRGEGPEPAAVGGGGEDGGMRVGAPRPGRRVGSSAIAEGQGRPVRRSTRRGPAQTKLSVGSGILVRMGELEDHPLRDSQFFENSNGSRVEQCWGTKSLSRK